jgi:pSer/pThr/pTyr-binding forkhead associated (FHA) protein
VVDTAFDIFMLILRITLIFLLYFFVFLTVRAIGRELSRPVSRASTVGPEPGYPPEDSISPAAGRSGGPAGRLVVTSAGNASTVRPGNIFELGPVMPIGRRQDNAIVLDDDFVSSEHALLSWREGRWWLSDAASSNGTFLNGQRISQPSLVNWGDQIGIGGVQFRLEP